MQNLHLPECSAEAFECHVHHYQGLVVLIVLLELPSINNGAHGTEKFLPNTRVNEDFP